MTASTISARRRFDFDGRWLRVLLALASGGLAAIAHPPFGFILGLAGYPLLMILSERSGTTRGAFWMGWLSGFAYFFIGCWWVAEAFFVNPAQAWMAPFAASLLPAGLGLFWGAAMALYRRFKPKGVRRALMFAALFCLFEWLRGHVLTGFPWNPAGASWKAGGAMSQAASLVGVYCLSLITLVAVASIGVLLTAGRRRDRFITAGLGAALLVVVYVYGGQRLGGAQVESSGVLVRIVQANIDQESKWTPEAYADIVRRYVTLTGQPAARRPDIVIWPEGALPASANQVFATDASDGQAIAQALQPGQILLAGLSRGLADPAAEGGARYFNSLFVLRDIGEGGLRIEAIYDKYRLVPFGEFLPGASVLGALGVRSLTHMPVDFSPGPSPAPVRIAGLGWVQPLICYESLYPGFTPGGAGRPSWIANVSNDAWFGKTSGPLQHLNLASYRAIETGLPIARATPTGVSAMIDPWGRVVTGARLESGVSGVIDAELPQAAAATLYSRWKDALFWVFTGCALIAGYWPRRGTSN